DPPGAHHAEQAGGDEQVHVVGDGALGAADRLRHLGDRGGSLEQQLQKGAAQRVGQRAQLTGSGDHDRLVEGVIRDLLIDRHTWTVLWLWIIRSLSSDDRSVEMAEVVLFHHVQGLTDGVRAFADELRTGGHTVDTPDLYDGPRPATLDDGIALTPAVGDRVAAARAARAAACP